jgi:hypothetical protein
MGIPETIFDEDTAGADERRQPANQATSDAERDVAAGTSWMAALSARSIEEQVAPI